MIERKYSKDSSNAYQVLTTTITATRETVFWHLATPDGISKWFPELSLQKESDEQAVLFDMGDGTFEKMALLDYKTDEHIAYEWATGKVEFELTDHGEGTQLIFKESLPLDFNAIPQDFTGWFVQINHIKSMAEKGSSYVIDKEELKNVKQQINKTLIDS